MHLCTRRWMAVVVRGISLDRHGVGMLHGRVTLCGGLVQQLYAQTQANRNPRECMSVTGKKIDPKERTKDRNCWSCVIRLYFCIMKNRKSLLKYGNVIFLGGGSSITYNRTESAYFLRLCVNPLRKD